MLLIFFILFVIFPPPITSRHVEFYRKDYTYIEEFDAFYKMHWDLNGRSWDSAFLTCDDEGATLFYPKAKEEWILVKNLTNKMKEVPNVTDIFVGIHNEFGLGEFITVDGHSTPYPVLTMDDLPASNMYYCITMNMETRAFKMDACSRIPTDTPLPFVCKKLNNESCPTVDRNYKYSVVTKKCYKVNKRQKIWQDAMQTCFMEGGVLAVIENRAVADVVREMIDREERHFVGVRRLFHNSDFYTVKGQKFSELYQMPYDNNDSYDCGAVYNNGNGILRTTTADCGSRLPFICEMDVA